MGCSIYFFSFHANAFILSRNTKIPTIQSQFTWKFDQSKPKKYSSDFLSTYPTIKPFLNFVKLSQTRVNDPTALFNQDISRILSYADHEKNKDSNVSYSQIPSKDLFTAATEANAMLQHMIELYQSGHPNARPNRETFLLVMKGFNICRVTGSPGKKQKYVKDAEQMISQLHQQMIQLWNYELENISVTEQTQEYLSPTIETFNLLLSTHVASGNIDQIEIIMDEMARYHINLNLETWKFIVQTWSNFIFIRTNKGKKDNKSLVNEDNDDRDDILFYIKKMDEYLSIMEDIYMISITGIIDSTIPKDISKKAIDNNMDINMEDNDSTITKDISTKSKDNNMDINMDDNDGLRAIQMKESNTIDKGKEFLLLCNLSTETAYLLQAYQSITYALVRIPFISSSTNSNSWDAIPLHVDSILRRMHSFIPISLIYSNAVLVCQIYTSQILAWSRLAGKGNTKSKKHHHASSLFYNPSLHERKMAAHKSNDVLYELLEICKNQHIYIQEQVHLQKTSKTPNMDKNQENTAFHIPEPMIPPVIAFNCVINAWGNCCINGDKDSLQNAENVLKLLKRLKTSIQLNSSHNIMDILQHHKTKDSNTLKSYESSNKNNTKNNDFIIHLNVKPNISTYNALIGAISKYSIPISSKKFMNQNCLNGQNAVQKISMLINEMEDNNIVPDAFTCSNVIGTYLRWGSTPALAHSFLIQMEKQCNDGPNVRHYSLVLNKYAKLGLPEEAQELLVHLENLYLTTNDISVKPDVISYTNVIEAWGKSQHEDRGRRALQILSRMMIGNKAHIPNFFNHGDINFSNNDNKAKHSPIKVIPTVRTFTAVIQALAKHNMKGNADIAYSLLHTMKEMNINPNTYTYNYVIYALANVPFDFAENNKDDLFKKAATIFKQLHQNQYDNKNYTENHAQTSKKQWRKEYMPNSLTYAFFIKACQTLLPISSKRNEMIMKTFQLCCRHGYLSKEVLYRVQCACDLEFCAKVFDVHPLEVAEISIDHFHQRCSRHT